MLKKLISKTYLRDITEYELKIIFQDKDAYIAIKKILKTTEPFITQDGICAIDNGYYIVEVLPKNEHYAMRVFFNDKKERVEYYFDITLKNDIDEETKIPYYYDLYTDIVVAENLLEVLDEDELQEAFNNKKITKEQYELANKTTASLLESIKNKTNKYMNMNLEKYLN